MLEKQVRDHLSICRGRQITGRVSVCERRRHPSILEWILTRNKANWSDPHYTAASFAVIQRPVAIRFRILRTAQCRKTCIAGRAARMQLLHLHKPSWIGWVVETTIR